MEDQTRTPPGRQSPGLILQKAQTILSELQKYYGEVPVFLKYKSCFELMIGVILSAQTTDAQVNNVLPELFGRFPGHRELAGAEVSEIETIIRSTGFYRVKAKNIKNAAKCIGERFGGTVPETIGELITIPGVGRKSANVVIGACYGKPAVIVDTHFGRVVRRLGFTDLKNPDLVEFRIREILPEEDQYSFSMLINLHGRMYCLARKPKCRECFLKDLCDFTEKNL